MKRFGCRNHLAHSMNENDVFLSRLHLLIVVVKASLKGYPVGKYRKKAGIENANEVYKLISKVDISFMNLESASHLFRERVKLLTVMVSAIIGENYPLGVHRREAMLNNVEIIEEYAFPHKKLKLFDKVLKVA